MTKQIRIPKFERYPWEPASRSKVRASDLGFLSDFVIRHSSFAPLLLLFGRFRRGHSLVWRFVCGAFLACFGRCLLGALRCALFRAFGRSSAFFALFLLFFDH